MNSFVIFIGIVDPVGINLEWRQRESPRTSLFFHFDLCGICAQNNQIGAGSDLSFQQC